MRRSLLCLVAALVSTVVSAFDNFDPVPGGIAGVPVGGAHSPAPRAFFGVNQLPVLRAGDTWIALVGIPRDLAPGFYVVNVVDAEEHHDSRAFSVRPTTRPIYTVEPPAGTTASELAERHGSARVVVSTELDDTIDAPGDMDFILPVDQAIRFHFGLLRIKDTGYALPFSGLGFATSKPVAVVNPAFGQVVEVDDSTTTDRVVIHHGGGLTSVFSNLGSVSVSRDEWLPKGALVGSLPARSGVSLLPDWSVLLNNVEIDPLLLVSQTIDLNNTTRQ